MSITDVSVFAGRWPFRAHLQRTPEQLKAYLSERGVAQAWVASASAILYPDPMVGNETLFATMGDDAFFVKVAIVDVTLATWERDVAHCFDRWGCGAVKLLPNYHGYDLEDARVRHLVDLCAERKAVVCIQVRMMDERAHHPLMKVSAVPVEQIVRLARSSPKARFLVCGAYLPELRPLQAVDNVWADISFVESGHALRSAVQALGTSRLVFGSHVPLHSFAAAKAKLDVPPGDVEPENLSRIRTENARTLLMG